MARCTLKVRVEGIDWFGRWMDGDLIASGTSLSAAPEEILEKVANEMVNLVGPESKFRIVFAAERIGWTPQSGLFPLET